MNRSVLRWDPQTVEIPPGIDLRPINDDDPLGDLMERAYKGTIDEHLGGNNDGAVEIADWRATGALPHASFVAVADGTVVSASLVSQGNGEHWLAYVITDPDHKNKGLGTAVVAASLNALRTTVFAAVTDGNTPSERLLARLGFTPVR